MPRIPLSLTITSKGSKAQIKLIGEIYDWRNSAAEFESKVEELINQGVKDADLYMFSNGGDSIQANEIGNIIDRFPGEIHGVGGAMVASACSYIAMKCKTFKMPANGMLMIHKPELNARGNEDNINGSIDILKSITADYRKVYAAKTGMTEDEVETLWKCECYMNATVAKERKFCDAIIEEELMDAQVVEQMITSWDRTTIPTALFTWAKNLKPKISNQNSTTMKKITAALKMDENSSEEQLAQKVNDIQTENQQLKTKIESLEKKEKDSKTAEATIMVDAAVKDGRLDTTTKDSWMKMFEANHDSAKAAITALKQRQKATDLISIGTGSEQQDTKVLSMSWDELDKTGKLADVKAKHPDVYKEKFKSKFGRDPKNV